MATQHNLINQDLYEVLTPDMRADLMQRLRARADAIETMIQQLGGSVKLSGLAQARPKKRKMRYPRRADLSLRINKFLRQYTGGMKVPEIAEGLVGDYQITNRKEKQRLKNSVAQTLKNNIGKIYYCNPNGGNPIYSLKS